MSLKEYDLTVHHRNKRTLINYILFFSCMNSNLLLTMSLTSTGSFFICVKVKSLAAFMAKVLSLVSSFCLKARTILDTIAGVLALGDLIGRSGVLFPFSGVLREPDFFLSGVFIPFFLDKSNKVICFILCLA